MYRQPPVVIEFSDADKFRKLNTKLQPGECKTLYSGVEVYNRGNIPCHLTIRTPKTEHFEALADKFFTEMQKTQSAHVSNGAVVIGKVI